MLKIKYDIKLNEHGRPYIYLPEDYRDNPEDRFFALELSRYMLQMIFARKSNSLDAQSVESMKVTLGTLEKISDEVAVLLKEQMELLGDNTMMFHQNYHIKVKTIKERNDLNYEGIVEGGKIFKRQEGLRVFVEDEAKIYELQDGIDNKNWEEI